MELRGRTHHYFPPTATGVPAPLTIANERKCSLGECMNVYIADNSQLRYAKETATILFKPVFGLQVESPNTCVIKKLS